MNLLGALFGSSIGRKFLMAITGLVLVGFVVGHLVGNLQIFAHPDKINGYAHFLQSLGPALWGIRLFLLACVGIHVWAAIALVLENKAARGPEAYGVSQWLQAVFASRYMKHTGLVVLAFLIYHLAHFTIGAAQAGTFKTALPEYAMAGEFHLLGFPIVAGGAHVHDVYSMVFLGFASPVVSVFYIIAVGLLSLHLLHGVESMFQTFGLRNHRWSAGLRRFAALFCLAYFLGNLAIPGAILTGAVKPAAGTAAAAQLVSQR
ncbi:MAG: succinate dehydrogenase / fumarate reductase, cytochrome b subunit [Verrucomicrobiota bacterium]|nr:succinate dehydrogenase / fumarate reductase, cytochrome b subunit [Verrucomicrobiota bacterium]